jgi:hypothetical protein
MARGAGNPTGLGEMPNALGSNTLDNSTRTTAQVFPSTQALNSVKLHNLVMDLALRPGTQRDWPVTTAGSPRAYTWLAVGLRRVRRLHPGLGLGP